MKTKTNTAHEEKYTADGVIARGYEIYDGWNDKKYSSRQIVSDINSVIANAKNKKSYKTSIESLAHFFALDMRLKEKYNGLLNRIFSYFSWRRETRALLALMQVLHIPRSMDARTAIEVELKKLLEEIGKEEVEEEDDETRGGKKNNKMQDDAIAKKEEQEKTADDSVKDNSELEEAEDTEEKSEDLQEEQLPEERVEETVDEAQSLDIQEESLELTVSTENILTSEEISAENKVENNGSNRINEPSNDKKFEAKTYNDTLDYPGPFIDEPQENRKESGSSYIQEFIWDELIKEQREASQNDSQGVGKDEKTADKNENSTARQNVDNNKSDKDAHLYDEMMKNDKGEPSPENKNDKAPKTEAKAEAKPKAEAEDDTKQIKKEEPKVPIDNTEKHEAIKNDFKDLRVPLQVDLTQDYENELRREISNSMTSEMVLAIHEKQENYMREQLDIALEEFLMNANEQKVSKPVEPQISQQPLSQNLK